MSLKGKLAPGPDYKLYLSPEFVETEADFLRLKPRTIRIGDVRTFANFLVSIPPNVDPMTYTSVIVWCERSVNSLPPPSIDKRCLQAAHSAAQLTYAHSPRD